jgi:hypothetical protein
MKKNSTRNRSRSYSPYSRQSVETDINDLRIALIEKTRKEIQELENPKKIDYVEISSDK